MGTYSRDRKALFSSDGHAAGEGVVLFLNHNANPRAPCLVGRLNGRAVAAYARTGPSGPFLSIVGPKVRGVARQIAVGNVVVVEDGQVGLGIRLGRRRERLWAMAQPSAPMRALVACGLDPSAARQDKDAEGADLR